jgi:hypothetical protein
LSRGARDPTLDASSHTTREGVSPVFKELTSELLDLTATEKGYRMAVYAAAEEPGSSSSSSGCSTVILCGSIHICW